VGRNKEGRPGYTETSGIQREENKAGRREYRRQAGIPEQRGGEHPKRRRECREKARMQREGRNTEIR
jgi:hypothetical protein